MVVKPKYRFLWTMFLRANLKCTALCAARYHALINSKRTAADWIHCLRVHTSCANLHNHTRIHLNERKIDLFSRRDNYTNTTHTNTPNGSHPQPIQLWPMRFSHIVLLCSGCLAKWDTRNTSTKNKNEIMINYSRSNALIMCRSNSERLLEWPQRQKLQQQQQQLQQK